ncbi:MAG: hypothetical protein V1897_19185 [Pseudomonadota bacterium]
MKPKIRIEGLSGKNAIEFTVNENSMINSIRSIAAEFGSVWNERAVDVYIKRKNYTERYDRISITVDPRQLAIAEKVCDILPEK